MSPRRPAEQVGVLTIRTWVEPGLPGWRARVIKSHDVQAGASTTTVFNSVDAVCDAVRDWLEAYIDDAHR